MGKKIRLRESELHAIVGECVKKILESSPMSARDAALEDMRKENDEVDRRNRVVDTHNAKADAVNSAIDRPVQFRSNPEWMKYLEDQYRKNRDGRFEDRADALDRIGRGERMGYKDSEERPWDLSSFKGSRVFDRAVKGDLDMLKGWNGD